MFLAIMARNPASNLLDFSRLAYYLIWLARQWFRVLIPADETKG
jgi:hypothetical protein